MRINVLWMWLFFPVVFLLVFNPYTIYGKPGVVVGGLCAVYAFLNNSCKIIIGNYAVAILLIIMISLWGACVSYVNNIGQFDFLYASLSFVVFLFSAAGVCWFLCKKGLDLDGFLRVVFFSLLFNSVFIIVEANVPILRDVVESFLAPAGNIDWKQGIRYRGLAASGGSGLSICCAIGILLSIHLYGQKKISVFLFMVSALAFLVSVLFIGRTGLVFFPVAIAAYFWFAFLSGRAGVKGILTWSIVLVVFLGLFLLMYDELYAYLESTFGASFINYSFGFLLKGADGFKEEGTAAVIYDFMTVLPLGFPEAIIGLGFYGGSTFTPWTDSGYARVLLSVGFIGGALYYLSIFYIYLKGVRRYQPLFWSILLVIALAEAKGSFLFSAYAARVFALIMIFYHVENYHKRHYSH